MQVLGRAFLGARAPVPAVTVCTTDGVGTARSASVPSAAWQRPPVCELTWKNRQAYRGAGQSARNAQV